MEYNKIFEENIEYSTKEMIGYFLVAHKKIKKSTLSNYIKEIMIAIEKIEKKDILKEIDINKIARFPIQYSVDNEELMSFALVLFFKLLKSNKQITDYDIIEELKIIMCLYSTRTIIHKAENYLNQISHISEI